MVKKYEFAAKEVENQVCRGNVGQLGLYDRNINYNGCLEERTIDL